MLTEAEFFGRAVKGARTGLLTEAENFLGRAVNGGCESMKAVTPMAAEAHATPPPSTCGGSGHSCTLGFTGSSGLGDEEERCVAARRMSSLGNLWRAGTGGVTGGRVCVEPERLFISPTSSRPWSDEEGVAVGDGR